MATKGTNGTAEMSKQIEQTRKGQQAKREARHTKRRQQEALAVASAKNDKAFLPTVKGSQEALHALFSATRKIIAGNHVSRNPMEILRGSKEMRKAMALHGHEACARRVYDACEKSGLPSEEAAKFATMACR